MIHRGADRVFRSLSAIACTLGLGSCGLFAKSPEIPKGQKELTYEVAEEGDELRVEATFPKTVLAPFSVRAGAERFVRDLRVFEGGSWSRPTWDRALRGYAFSCDGGCVVRYRFQLAKASQAFGEPENAAPLRSGNLFSPSLFLLRPALAGASDTFSLRVRPEARFVSGLPKDDRGRFVAQTMHLPVLPYAALGRFRTTEVLAGGAIQVAIGEGDLAVDDATLSRWVGQRALEVMSFLGCFPVPRLLVVVVPKDGDSVADGTTLGNGGATIVLSLGSRATESVLGSDWVLTHELLHLAIPSLPKEHHWMEEGASVYLTSLVRAREGRMTELDVWREFRQNMARSHPRGLDGVTSHDDTYGGGAFFFLLADIEIRKRTRGRMGVTDAIRGILSSGGNVAVAWDLTKVIAAADHAVGVSVFRELYERHGHGEIPFAFERTFRELGVVMRKGEVVLRRDAPLHAVRESLVPARPTDEEVVPLLCMKPEQPIASWLSPAAGRAVSPTDPRRVSPSHRQTVPPTRGRMAPVRD